MDNTPHTPASPHALSRMKRAELLSSLGAGVLGAGLALLVPNLLARYAVPMLLVGLVSHGIGMARMRSLEQQSHMTRVWWMEALYWGCWLALAGVLVYIVYSLIAA